MELGGSRSNYSSTMSTADLDETHGELENHRSPRQLRRSIFGETLTSKPTDGQSPMTQLTESMRDFHWFNQTPRRRLSLESNTPTPNAEKPPKKTCDQGGVLFNSPGLVEVDDSPFFQERCSMRGSSSLVMRVGRPSTLPAPNFSLEHSSPLTPLDRHSILDKPSDQVKKVPLCQEVVSSRIDRAFSDETNHPKRFLPNNKCAMATKVMNNKTNWKPVSESKDSKSFTFPLQPTIKPQSKGYNWKPTRALRLTGNTLGLHHLLSSPILEIDEESMMGQQKGLRRRRLLATEDQENINPNAFLDNLMKDYQRVGPNSCKRVLRNHDDVHPVKKRRSNADYDVCQQSTPLQAKAAHPLPMKTEESSALIIQKTVTPRFVRCHSETEVIIKSALSRADMHQDLIGDFTRPYALPLAQSKHHDLKAISSDTLASLLNGEYGDEVCNYVIVDCRYPYEYDGGHIRGALNIYTKDEIISAFLTSRKYHCCTSFQKKTVLIFHCEFSSERGPRLMHFLRNKDREMHRETYPALFYPEMYLLEGGYKAFFESHKMLCEPVCYKPMIHCDHAADLKHFRAKSKSWTAAGSERTQAGIRMSRQLSERQSSTGRQLCRKLP